MSMNLIDIAILNIKPIKTESIKLLQNIDLTKKGGTLYKRNYQEKF